MTLLDDLLADLKAEGDQLWNAVGGLDEAGWRTPTPAAGWDVATQVAHLLWTDETATAAATDKEAWDAVVVQAIEDPTGFVDTSALEVAVVANPMPPLPAAVEVAAYRIVSEALNNVSRHAGARTCRVGIALDDGGILRLEVEDDGVGLPAEVATGIGLAAMRERAVELGGTCEAVPGAPRGTRVEARIPVGSR